MSILEQSKIQTAQQGDVTNATPGANKNTANKPSRRDKKERALKAAAGRREIPATVRTSLNLASAVVAVASVFFVLPYILIVEICRELLGRPADTGHIRLLLAGAVILLVIRALLLAGAYAWSHLIDAGYQLTVRRALVGKLTRVPLGWFSDRTSGEVTQFLRDDVDALHYSIAHARLDFVGAIVVPLITVLYLFTVDWRLTLVSLVPLVGYGMIVRTIMSPAHRDRMASYTRAEKRVQEATIEFIDGIQVVRVFGRMGQAHDVFREAVDEQTRRLTSWKRPVTVLHAVSDVIVGPVFVMAIVVLVGVAAVATGRLDVVNMVPFLLVGLGLGSSLLGLGYGAQSLRSAQSAAQRLYDLHRTSELASHSGEVASPDARSTNEPTCRTAGRVRFESVSFGYRADRPVLHDITTTLEPGTITALVGPSGSGKSTLAKLLPRFYDVTGGHIIVDGRDIRDIPSDELYRTVGFVFQDVRLVSGTVRDNLVLARTDADSSEIRRAAATAQIHDRIMELPRGYDSVIGEDAILSGGEAQRLSVARALLANTPILVLDEATAFADPESEAAVQDALAAAVADRTVLVIAHRLHTITGVDRILVLDNGGLVEQGTHEGLRGAGGTYQRLWEINDAALSLVSSAAEETR